MGFSQLIPFDTSKGGNVPNLCLDNVRRGYGIGNKYGSAWEAWQHTQQHPDRNIPNGLDIPIYYSYNATIDGVTQNYGHINVQLANGTVWSDGNIYASIEDYTSKKLPKFVGWGESINDFKIIQGGSMNPNPQQAGDTYKAFATEADGITPGDISQKDLDIAIQTPWAQWIPNFYPGVQTLRNDIKLLTEDRDNNLYPYINAVTEALGLPASATKEETVTAINNLKKSSAPKSVIIDGVTYIPK